jgi:hypothetical protein
MLTAYNFTNVSQIRKQLEDEIFLAKLAADLLLYEVLDTIADREGPPELPDSDTEWLKG